MQRTICEGLCPNYWVEITGDGDVTYCGVMFVEQRSEFRRRVGIKQVVKLIAATEAAKFWDLNDIYDGRMLHAPATIIEVEQRGRYKSVSDFSGERAAMPAGVSRLQNLIDEIGGTAEWVGKWDGRREDGWLDGESGRFPECGRRYWIPFDEIPPLPEEEPPIESL